MKFRRKFLEEDASGFTRLPSYPIKHADKLDALNYIFNLYKLDAEKCMKAYLGQGGDKIYRGIVNENRQREIAKRPRTDAIQRLIEEIIQKEPKISAKDMLQSFERRKGDGVIMNIIYDREEIVIKWQKEDGSPGKDLKFSALEKRLSRAKKEKISLTG